MLQLEATSDSIAACTALLLSALFTHFPVVPFRVVVIYVYIMQIFSTDWTVRAHDPRVAKLAAGAPQQDTAANHFCGRSPQSDCTLREEDANLLD